MEPDAERRVAAEKNELPDAVPPARFEQVKGAAHAHVEKRRRVFLGGGELHHDLRAAHGFVDGLSVSDVARNGNNVSARDRRPMHQGADREATPLQRAERVPAKFPAGSEYGCGFHGGGKALKRTVTQASSLFGGTDQAGNLCHALRIRLEA